MAPARQLVLEIIINTFFARQFISAHRKKIIQWQLISNFARGRHWREEK